MTETSAVELPGMSGASPLRRFSAGDETVVCSDERLVFRDADGDIAMRNLAICALRDAEATGLAVAEVFGLSPEQVSRVRSRAKQEGSAGLVRPRGRRPKLSERQVATARRLAGEGKTQTEIAKRFGVSQSIISDLLAKFGPAPAPFQGQFVPSSVPAANEPVNNEPASGLARITTGVHPSRYAGGALAYPYPYLDMVGAAEIRKSSPRCRAAGRAATTTCPCRFSP